jgi:hypothetical protein
MPMQYLRIDGLLPVEASMYSRRFGSFGRSFLKQFTSLDRTQKGGAMYRGCAGRATCIAARSDLAYLALAAGSIPLFLTASAARGEAKNAINRFALSICPEPATTAAENVWGNWISVARLPA